MVNLPTINQANLFPCQQMDRPLQLVRNSMTARVISQVMLVSIRGMALSGIKLVEISTVKLVGTN